MRELFPSVWNRGGRRRKSCSIVMPFATPCTWWNCSNQSEPSEMGQKRQINRCPAGTRLHPWQMKKPLGTCPKGSTVASMLVGRRRKSLLHFRNRRLLRHSYYEHVKSISKDSSMFSHSNCKRIRRNRLMVMCDQLSTSSTPWTCSRLVARSCKPVRNGEISSNKPILSVHRWRLSSICPTSKKPSGTSPDGFKTFSMLSVVRPRGGK